MPPHAPVHPPNVAPVVGVATSVTVAFCANVAEQIVAPLPQLIAPAPPLTAPLPLTATVSWTAGVKVAVTARSAAIVTVQVGPVPVQSPVHPVRTYPSFGFADNVTVELRGSAVEQVAGPVQSMPAPLTVPLPETATSRFAVAVAAFDQLAFTARLPFISTVQAMFVPEQSPPQPLKTFPASGVSSTVSVEPSGTFQLQSLPEDPQSTSLLPPVTSPEPV